MAPRVAVLDYGMGNLRSVAKALERAGASVELVHEVPGAADALVVPGQGAFGSCMTNLGARAAAIAEWIGDGRPFLGICLGLQVLFERSEESDAKGLGVLEGEVRRFARGARVPHIGWNEVEARAGSPMFAGIAPGTRFYFVHSYYAAPSGDVTEGSTEYAGVRFCSAAASGRAFATQFHPEKSGAPGLRLLQNFLGTCA